jgi:hypothetical protein
VVTLLGGYQAVLAAGLALGHDHDRQFMSDAF